MRRTKLLVPLLGLVCSFALVVPAHAATMRSLTDLTVAEPIADDAFLSGQTVTVTVPPAGELVAAGNTVELKQTSFKSIYIAGSNITDLYGSGYNAVIIGGKVTLGGTFAHDVYVVGSDVTFADDTKINGELRVAGTSVKLAGTIAKSVWIDTNTAESKAVVGGDFHSVMSALNFTGGSVAGDLRYTANADAQNLSAVKVTGSTVRTTPPQRGAAAYVMDFLATLLFAILIVLLAPRRSRKVLSIIMDKYPRSMAYGLVGLIAIPVLAMLFLATEIGWQVAALLVLVYGVLLLISGAMGMFLLGTKLVSYLKLPFFSTNTSANLAATTFIGVLVFSLLIAIPQVGGLALVLFWIFAAMPAVGALIQLVIHDNHQ